MNIEFTNKDDVIQLSDSNFAAKKDGYYLKKGKRGVIIAYAPWCGACKGKVDDIKALASIVNTKPTSNASIYVIDADSNKSFSQSVGLMYFPSYYQVLPSGKIQTTSLELDLSNEIDQIMISSDF